ncbi:helix-hairpin-helix domain-containing protein [Roseibium algae]|uniref:Helix-hairpin-helix domain-containing protein n=1 Tax=Roseibium algae TaxID=3123038 RepID=A0ABU8TKG6_9HYPH
MSSISEVKGVGPTLAATLAGKGVDTAEKLISMPMDDLLAVPGVGPSRAKLLIENAKLIANNAGAAGNTVKKEKASKPVSEVRVKPVKAVQEKAVAPKPEETKVEEAKPEETASDKLGAGENKSRPTAKELRKEVKNRLAKLKKQKAKLKQAKKALKKAR